VDIFNAYGISSAFFLSHLVVRPKVVKFGFFVILHFQD
jgi:hypothetical protein